MSKINASCVPSISGVSQSGIQKPAEVVRSNKLSHLGFVLLPLLSFREVVLAMGSCGRRVAPFFAKTRGYGVACERRGDLKVHQAGVGEIAHAEVLCKSIAQVHVKVSCQMGLHLRLMSELEITGEPRTSNGSACRIARARQLTEHVSSRGLRLHLRTGRKRARYVHVNMANVLLKASLGGKGASASIGLGPVVEVLGRADIVLAANVANTFMEAANVGLKI